MGGFSDFPRNVVENDRFTEMVTHYPETHETDQSGYENPEFDDAAAQERPVLVSEPEASDFEITETGSSEKLSYIMTAMVDAAFEDDDRVWYDNGLSTDPYRITSPRTVMAHGDRMIRWAMATDQRGQGAGGSGMLPDADAGDDTSDGGTDDGGSDDSDDGIIQL